VRIARRADIRCTEVIHRRVNDPISDIETMRHLVSAEIA